MRLSMRLAAGVTAVGLGTVVLPGCTVSGFPASSGAGPSTASPAMPAAAHRIVTSTAPSEEPVSPRLRAGVRAAAAQVLALYSARKFTAFWSLLSPATKRQVSPNAWVSVHEACSSAGDGKPRVIKAVTVFGNAAIVTETIVEAPPRTTEIVFNYVDGHWSFSPEDLSVYDHGSAGADIAAAKAAGLCASWRIF
jgi:hypothetical protein